MKKILSKLCNNKKIILSCVLFLIVLVCLGLPYTHWWFNGSDDFHGVYMGFKTKTLKELFYFFIDGNVIGKYRGPSNFIHQTQFQATFFGTYYRPLYLMFAALQYWLFGTNGYAYLLCNVSVHAINTVLLFNLFSLLTTLFPAFLAALLFAFHPQVAYRFGATINLHYYVNVMFMLLTIISFKHYLDTKKIMYYLASCILFALALFTRESSIVLPGIIFLGTYLYTNDQHTLLIKNFFQQFFTLLHQTAGFCFVALSFLAFRVSLYPIVLNRTPITDFFQIPVCTLRQAQGKRFFHPFVVSLSNHTNGLTSLTTALQAKIQELLVFVYDFFWLSWLPWGHKLLRGSLMFLLITLCFWLFIKSTKKVWVVYFLLCTALMMWPAYVGCYSPRYIYEALPFVIAAFIVLFQFQAKSDTSANNKLFISNMTMQPNTVIPAKAGIQAYGLCGYEYASQFNFSGSPPSRGRHHSHTERLLSFKSIGLCLLSIYTLFLMIFAIENFCHRERKMAIFSNALQQLVTNPAITNRPLCLLSYPADGLGDNPTDIIRVLLKDLDKQIYCDSTAALVQTNANIVSPVGWRNLISNYYTQNYVQITPMAQGFRFVSTDPNKISFTIAEKDSYSLGQKVVHKKDAAGSVIDFTLLIEQRYLSTQPIFLYWDYETKEFALIKEII